MSKKNIFYCTLVERHFCYLKMFFKIGIMWYNKRYEDARNGKEKRKSNFGGGGLE